MDVLIEDTIGCALPADCFVSVRVGEALKGRRYHSGVNYGFPMPEKRVQLKCDVYKHIGEFRTLVDPGQINFDKEVTVVPVAEGVNVLGQDTRVKVKMRSTQGKENVPVPAKNENRKVETKSAAQGYLQKHRLDEVLQEAVRNLLVTKPEDPIAAMCEHLKGLPKMYPTVPKAKEEVSDLKQFRSYYSSNVLPQASQESLYAKFPAATKPPPVSIAATSKPVVRELPSVGTWLTPKPAPLKLVSSPLPACVAQSWCIEGFARGKSMRLDERLEVERAVAQAACEFTGDLEGEYFPLPYSDTYPARPGGMTEWEQHLLNSDGILFGSPADPSARGIFATKSRHVALWVNAEDSHVACIVNQKKGGTKEAVALLRNVEKVLRDMLMQSGYTLAVPLAVPLQIPGLRSPQDMSEDERCEVERILTEAFLSFTGPLSGVYYPMPSSSSIPSEPFSGMSDKLELKSFMKAGAADGGVLHTANAAGRGLFVTDSSDLVVRVNMDEEQHAQIVARGKGGEASALRFASILKDIIQQAGYA